MLRDMVITDLQSLLELYKYLKSKLDVCPLE